MKTKLIVCVSVIMLYCVKDNKVKYNDLKNNKMKIDEMKKWKTFKLQSGECIYHMVLNTREYNEIMKQSFQLKDVTKSFGELLLGAEVKVYEMQDGNILASENGYYTVYKNINDLKKMIENYNISNSSELLYKSNPYGKDFALHVDDLANQIYGLISVKSNDASEVLNGLDSFIRNNPNYASHEYLINYIALVGDLILKKHHGSWGVELASDKETWNPYLKINGKNYHLIVYVYEDVIQNEEPSLYLTYASVCGAIDFNQRANK